MSCPRLKYRTESRMIGGIRSRPTCYGGEIARAKFTRRRRAAPYATYSTPRGLPASLKLRRTRKPTLSRQVGISSPDPSLPIRIGMNREGASTTLNSGGIRSRPTCSSEEKGKEATPYFFQQDGAGRLTLATNRRQTVSSIRSRASPAMNCATTGFDVFWISSGVPTWMILPWWSIAMREPIL